MKPLSPSRKILKGGVVERNGCPDIATIIYDKIVEINNAESKESQKQAASFKDPLLNGAGYSTVAYFNPQEFKRNIANLQNIVDENGKYNISVQTPHGYRQNG